MTTEFMQWANEHWWLAFWLAFWMLVFTYSILMGLLFSLRRIMRAAVVLIRGWPPAHLDADGDWKAKEKL